MAKIILPQTFLNSPQRGISSSQSPHYWGIFTCLMFGKGCGAAVFLFRKMEHRGKKIRERIEEFGVSKAFIYKKLKIDKKTFDRLLETHNPPDEMIERIGNIIRHDFTIDFPGMNKTVFEHDKTASAVAEPMIQLPQSVIKKLLSDVEEIKNKLLNPNK